MWFNYYWIPECVIPVLLALVYAGALNRNRSWRR